MIQREGARLQASTLSFDVPLSRSNLNRSSGSRGYFLEDAGQKNNAVSFRIAPLVDPGCSIIAGVLLNQALINFGLAFLRARSLL